MISLDEISMSISRQFRIQQDNRVLLGHFNFTTAAYILIATSCVDLDHSNNKITTKTPGIFSFILVYQLEFEQQ